MQNICNPSLFIDETKQIIMNKRNICPVSELMQEMWMSHYFKHTYVHVSLCTVVSTWYDWTENNFSLQSSYNFNLYTL